MSVFHEDFYRGRPRFFMFAVPIHSGILALILIITMNTPMSELKTKGFVTMSYPQELRKAVTKTVESWKRFSLLPVEIKKNLPYSNNADGIGYELKEGVGPNADRKENFDVTVAGSQWLEDNAKNIKDAVALEFIRNAVSLVGIMKPIVFDFAMQAEKEFSINGFVEEVSQSEHSFFIRFIHYFGNRADGEEIAVPHADQSGFTLHLFESAPGLQCLTSDGRWIDMPVSEGETIIIPSMQMQLRSKGELKALCHRVIATTETSKVGRYSAVCFVQLTKTLKYDKERHGRLQEQKPGFNYDMPLDTFSDQFKKI